MPTKTFNCHWWAEVKTVSGNPMPTITARPQFRWTLFLPQNTARPAGDILYGIKSALNSNAITLPYASNGLSSTDVNTHVATIVFNGLPTFTGDSIFQTASFPDDPDGTYYYEIVQSVTIETPDYLVLPGSGTPGVAFVPKISGKTDGGYYDVQVDATLIFGEELLYGGYSSSVPYGSPDSVNELTGGLRGGISGLPRPIVEPIPPGSNNTADYDHWSTHWVDPLLPAPSFTGALLSGTLRLDGSGSTSPNGTIDRYYWRIMPVEYADPASDVNQVTVHYMPPNGENPGGWTGDYPAELFGVPLDCSYPWDYTISGATVEYELPDDDQTAVLVNLWVVDEIGFMFYVSHVVLVSRVGFGLIATRSGALITANPETEGVQTYLTYGGSAQTQSRALIDGADTPSIGEDEQGRVILMARSDGAGYLTYASTDEARTFEVIP